MTGEDERRLVAAGKKRVRRRERNLRLVDTGGIEPTGEPADLERHGPELRP